MEIFTLEQAKQIREQPDIRLDKASAVLNAYPKGAMGLTLDSVKATQEWKDASLEADRAFRQLRTINSLITKHFKKENIADIQATREARLAALTH